MLDGERLYTETLEVNLFAFAYKLFHKDFSLFYEAEIFMKQSVGKHKCINFWNFSVDLYLHQSVKEIFKFATCNQADGSKVIQHFDTLCQMQQFTSFR